jgi:hypothetical protein
VLSSEAGRRVFGGIFHECEFWREVFYTDSVATAYHEGLRAAALSLANRILATDPMLLAQCEIDWRKFEAEINAKIKAEKEVTNE